MDERGTRRLVVFLALTFAVLVLLLGTLSWLLWPGKKGSDDYASWSVAATTSPPAASPVANPAVLSPVALAPRFLSPAPGSPVAVLASTLGNMTSALRREYAISPDNPSFPLTSASAHVAITDMLAHPRPLTRPLVIIGGYEDPGILQSLATEFFLSLSNGAKIIPISLQNCQSFDDCRAHILAQVNAACGNTEPNFTTEVDVLGISLGGAVARYAAAPAPNPGLPQRLRIARLFTLSSPLAGARAAMVGFTSFQQEIQPGSPVQKFLAAADANPSYEIYSYVHLGDEMVGQENAAIPGRNPYWLPNIPLVPILPHEQMMVDERALADIARRLRGETPYTLPNPVPLPKK